MVKISRSADISNDKKDRFSLSRIWDSKKPKALYIMLNPSYADDESDDPTIRRLIFFSKKFKFGGFYVTNLFTQITPYPKELNLDNNSKKKNLKIISELIKKSDLIVYAWGNLVSEPMQLRKLIESPLCFGINKNGTPKHPLYLRSDTKLQDFR
jgi:hypothetical protein|tara:strand:+ start:1347 stop:1808 length:462 start_codon:yes stop_codon:yes gene_type:complete